MDGISYETEFAYPDPTSTGYSDDSFGWIYTLIDEIEPLDDSPTWPTLTPAAPHTKYTQDDKFKRITPETASALTIKILDSTAFRHYKRSFLYDSMSCSHVGCKWPWGDRTEISKNHFRNTLIANQEVFTRTVNQTGGISSCPAHKDGYVPAEPDDITWKECALRGCSVLCPTRLNLTNLPRLKLTSVDHCSGGHYARSRWSQQCSGYGRHSIKHHKEKSGKSEMSVGTQRRKGIDAVSKSASEAGFQMGERGESGQ